MKKKRPGRDRLLQRKREKSRKRKKIKPVHKRKHERPGIVDPVPLPETPAGLL